MIKWKLSKKEYVYVGVILLLVCVISVSAFRSFFNGNEAEVEALFLEQFENDVQEEVETIENIVVIVDVKGAVYDPGVYEVEEGSRVIDVIEKAGGVLEDADVNQINFAQVLQDEMVIYVPKVGEESHIVQSGGIASSNNDKVRINYATSEELQKLTGIGPSKAEAIISYREENGLFQTAEDLLNVSGIGQKTFEKIKDEVTVK